jgi:hypothetical protein
VVAVMPSSLASQLLQDCGCTRIVGGTKICRSRLAGDAVVAVTPSSLASQLLQVLRGYVGFVV